MENYAISNARRRVQHDFITKSFSLSITSNNSGLLIQSNCNRTEYLCGPPCVQLTVERENNSTKFDPFSCITVAYCITTTPCYSDTYNRQIAYNKPNYYIITLIYSDTCYCPLTFTTQFQH